MGESGQISPINHPKQQCPVKPPIQNTRQGHQPQKLTLHKTHAFDAVLIKTPHHVALSRNIYVRVSRFACQK